MWFRAGTAVVALLLASGCTRPKTGDRPAIRYGTDTCTRCGMLVSEERFAAGYVDRQGVVVCFDDVGELLAAAAARPELLPIAWVHDTGSAAWVRAASASYVVIRGLATPMGSGIAAFAGPVPAAAFAASFGVAPPVLDAAAAVNLAAADPRGRETSNH